MTSPQEPKQDWYELDNKNTALVLENADLKAKLEKLNIEHTQSFHDAEHYQRLLAAKEEELKDTEERRILALQWYGQANNEKESLVKQLTQSETKLKEGEASHTKTILDQDCITELFEKYTKGLRHQLLESLS